ncbi:MAG TPA: pentapeptide repeat-containing protein, partial [Polyangiaceae bacterium]|nr:pentapeptide repeat-containing protein [Polyangiaceae bacterium]
ILRGANLMEAKLQKTTLHGADLSKTNLFLANLSQARLGTSTNIAGANLKRALMLPRARKET